MEHNAQKLLFLEELTSRVGQAQGWVRNSLDSLQLCWNETLYQTALDSVVSRMNPDALLLPFTFPCDQTEITGELRLGKVICTEIEFRLPISKLPMHIFTAGSSGSGKSTFGLRLAEEAYLGGIESIWIVDPKADDYVRLAQKYPDFLLLKWNELRFNPFTPPPNVPQNEWNQTVVGHIAQNFNFWQGAEGLFLRHLSRRGTHTVPELLRGLRAEKRGFGQKDAMVRATLDSRLEMLYNLFGETITADSDMLEKLSEMKVIISTAGLMTEAESWFTEFLLLWNYTYRVYNPEKRRLALHIYDECQHRLFSNEKEKKLQKLGSSVISQLVDQARALNMGICSMSQEPSTLIKAVINNSYLKIAFHLGSGTEVQVVRDAMGLDNEQADILHYLETGEAIVRMAGGWMNPMPVMFDNFDDSGCCKTKRFWQYQGDEKDKLLVECTAKRKLLVSSGISEQSDSAEQVQLKKTKAQTQLTINTRALTHSTSTGQPMNRVKPLLQVWLNLKVLFLTQGNIFKTAGITSGSAQAKIKKELVRQNLIIERRLQVGKTYSSVWEPTDKAFKLVGIEKPRLHSKGGYLHQFVAHCIREWGVRNGYKAEMESFLSNNKAVDLVLRNEHEVIFVEVAISSPLEKEIGNAAKDFGTELHPDRLIIAAKDSRMRKRLEDLMENDNRLEEYRDKIKVVLAGSFIGKG